MIIRNVLTQLYTVHTALAKGKDDGKETGSRPSGIRRRRRGTGQVRKKQAARIAVLGIPSSSASRRIFFNAMISPVTRSFALYTTPYVPSPIFSSFWYLPQGRQSRSHKTRHGVQTQRDPATTSMYGAGRGERSGSLG